MSASSTMITNIDYVVEKITPVFNEVAAKIGVGAEFGWEVVLRQQVAYASVAAFVALMGLIIFLVCLYGFIQGMRPSGDEDMAGACAFFGLLALVPFMWGTIAWILRSMNPEFYALNFFVRLIQ